MATTYLNGFNVRPAYTQESGVVVFTQGDGTDEFYPNQLQCEVYFMCNMKSPSSKMHAYYH